jgi:PTS system nitrogen regulatory IIA component
MQLTVRDVSDLLKVSEKTVYRWIEVGKIPGYRLSGQYRFNRAELLEWATANRLPVSLAAFYEREAPLVPPPELPAALEDGGIFYRLDGTDREAVLRNVVQVLRLPDEVDREFLYRALLGREELESTGVGAGVAIPHVRNPVVLHVPKPTLTLCFLESPVDFNALDRKPVQALFTLMSPTLRAHLNLLSRLGFALHDGEVRSLIALQAGRAELFRAFRRVAGSLAAGGSAVEEGKRE